MRTFRAWLIRASGMFLRRSAEPDITAELESHLQHHIDDNLRAGMTPAEARRVAVLRLGSAEAVKEAYRDRAGLPWLDGMFRDVRFACRTLARRPGFMLAATTTLALGIGANAAVFSIVDAVLLRPLPYPHPERIVEISGPGQSFVDFGSVLRVHPRELRDNPAFSSIGLYIAGGANLGGAPAVRVYGAAVSPGFFAALGVSPILGRTFTDADLDASDRVVVISHRLWRHRLMSDPLVVGRSLTVDGAAFVIMGVMPAGVSFPAASELWIPTNAPTALMGSVPAPRLIARLNEGVTPSHARSEVLNVTKMKESRAKLVKVEALREALVGAVRPVAVLIWIASALVMLIACINAANLLLARVSGREREFTVRRALGASRGQLVRQVFIESLALSAVAAVLALPAAFWTLETARALLPAQLHGASDFAISGRVILFTAAAALFTALIFGAGPCLSIRTMSGGVLRAQTAGMIVPFWRRFRSALLIGEIAMTMVLLAGAGTLVASVQRVMDIDIGATGERAVAIELTLAGEKYKSADLRRAFFSRLVAAVRALPGVETAGLATMLPGRAPAMLLARPMVPDGETPGPDRSMAIQMAASPGYFEAAGIDVLAGRTFTERDVAGAPPVVVVTEGYARALGRMPQSIIGARAGAAGTLRDGTALPAEEIIGVVRDVRLHGPETDFDPGIYSPLDVSPGRTGSMHLVVRGAGDPLLLVPAIRTVVGAIDADLPLFNVRTFDEIRHALLAERRFAMSTMVLFAALAFALSAIGLYGVVNYLVQLRSREIGIRLAIGASRMRICRDVLLSGTVHAVVGVTAGLCATAALAQVANSRVSGMQQIDVLMLCGLGAVVIAVAGLATWIPAWRAMRIDPALTLRAE